MKRSGHIRLAAFDALWLLSFFALWASVIVLWNTYWIILLLPSFVITLGGLSEFVHQGAHGNLFGRNRKLNELFGKISATLIGVNFFAYRKFHMTHHVMANTRNDTELKVYASEYTLAGVGWERKTAIQKLVSIPKVAWDFAGAGLSQFGARFPVSLVQWIFPAVIIAGIGYLQHLSIWSIVALVCIVWYLPLLLLTILEFFLTQSRHYGTQLLAESSRHIQYKNAWNLDLPLPIELMLLRRNQHATHHLDPKRHWSQMYRTKDARCLPLFTYLGMWWKEGPRRVHL